MLADRPHVDLKTSTIVIVTESSVLTGRTVLEDKKLYMTYQYI